MPKDKEYKYYKGSLTIGTRPDGKPERVYVRGKTKRERDDKLAEARRLYAKGISLTDMTVGEWSQRWLAVYKANVSDGQKRSYKARLEIDILPAFGNVRMRDIRPSHLQEFLNQYKGKKKGTVEKVRVSLKSLFFDAAVEGIIERDPTLRLAMPETEEKKRRPLTPFERDIALQVAESHPRGVYVLTMLYCGLRRGEAVALTVGDVDTERKRIHVSQSLSFPQNKGELKAPKSEAGTRTVPIPTVFLPTIAAVCSHRAAHEILFPKTDGTHATKQTCLCWWKSFVRACHIAAGAVTYRREIKSSPFGMEITPHYLRHTYATDLYAAGVDEKARKFFLGHSSNDVTDIYTKMSDKAFDRAAVLIDEYHSEIGSGKNGAKMDSGT
jgi:integrase